MNFFQCAFDASVTGLDVVATCARGWDNGQSTNFSASLNINNPVVEEVKKFADATGTTRTFFDGECIYDFKHAKPHWRSVPTATHHMRPFSIMASQIALPIRTNGTFTPFEVCASNGSMRW